MTRKSGFTLFVLTGLLCVPLCGCADKLTRERYEMIVVDTSTKTDVEYTLGEPSNQLPDQWHYERPDKHLNVFIHFNDRDVVTRKQWVDSMSTEWDDTQSPPRDRSHHESTTVRTINK
jgi:hypothetical protein